MTITTIKIGELEDGTPVTTTIESIFPLSSTWLLQNDMEVVA